MIISFSASVTGINTLLSKKFAWKINDLSTENLLDPVLNYTEEVATLTNDNFEKWLMSSSINFEVTHPQTPGYTSDRSSHKICVPVQCSCIFRILATPLVRLALV